MRFISIKNMENKSKQAYRVINSINMKEAVAYCLSVFILLYAMCERACVH